MHPSWFLFLIACFLLGETVCAGQPGINDTEIVLGQSCALSGPAQALGISMRAGLETYFRKINEDKGGVKGRKIRLISLDDGYEPFRAINNSRELIRQHQVFMLIGSVGTPTARAVVAMAEKVKIPFFTPLTGAEFLRTPFKRYVINVRGSYYQETEKIINYLVDISGKKKIACFYQNDEYGQAGLAGITNALARRSLALMVRGTYERNTMAVKGALIKISKAEPEAVVMIGAYKPCAAFIRLAKQIGMQHVTFCNISFVGAEALQAELGRWGEHTLISQVVTLPWKGEIPLVREYMEAMQRYQPSLDLGFVSLEGYMAAKLFCLAAERVDGDLTREKLIDVIDQIGRFDLGGIILQFGPNDHQGMDDIFLTVIRDEKIELLHEALAQ